MAAPLDEDAMFAPEEVLDIEEIKNIVQSSRISKQCEDALNKRVRTEEDVQIIYQLASTMLAFEARPKYARVELCKVFRYVTYAKGDIIFHEGDEPDGYYFILTGKVTGKKKNDDSKVERLKGLSEISQDTFTLHQGMGFGEGAYQRDSSNNPVFRSGGKRGATIQCAEDVQILKVDIEDYHKVLAYSFQQELEERVTFLSRMPLWASYSHEKLRELAKCMTVENPLPNKAVISQGVDDRLALFIVRSGELKVVKEMPVNVRRRVNTDEVNRTQEQVTTRTKLLHVATLGPGDYFGELAFLESSAVRSASVITSTKSELYKLPKGEFDVHVKPEPKVMDILKHAALAYATDDMILRAYEEELSWERYKKRLVRQLIEDRDAKKELARRNKLTRF